MDVPHVPTKVEGLHEKTKSGVCRQAGRGLFTRLRTPFPPYAQLPSRAVIAARMAPPPGTSAELSGLIGPP